MPNVTTGSTLAMFPDDSKCYKCIESIGDFDITQGDLDNLLYWSLANEMNFQPSKYENLEVSRKRISPVMVTKDLTWSNHVRYVTAKSNRMIGFIKRTVPE